MKYILYIFVIHGTNAEIESQEFNSVVACEAAKTAVTRQVKSMQRAESEGGYSSSAFCVEKG